MKPAYLALGLSLACCALTACGPRSGSPGKTSTAAAVEHCAGLSGKSLGSGVVRDASHVPEGTELVSLTKRMLVKTLAHFDLPPILAPRSFCRVHAELKPVPGSLIKVEVWLPDDWNGKMLAEGGGGFNGGLFGASVGMRPGAAKGFATVVTDVGHDMSDSAKFAHENREALIDYGYRGNHSTAEFAKQLIAAYYGRPARLAYFEGGSNGGREALMEAQRFPEDYDGIIAGMPAMSFTRLMTSFMWNAEAATAAPGLGAKLATVRKAVLDRCDALDGVVDGTIGDPLTCPFDPATLLCGGTDGTQCLTRAEVDALQRLHGGPRLRDGTHVLPGLATGSETHPTEMEAWILGEKALQPSMAQEAFRWMVYDDAGWDRSRFDIERDYPAGAKLASVLDSDDPDLSAFLKRGGKLLLHHGWNDAAIPPANTVAYYDAVLRMSGAAAAQQVRLFMVPGMGHGFGRPGPEYYDMLSQLDKWVEGGPAPEEVTAVQYERPPAPFSGPDASTKVTRTLLLCAWPGVARHDGKGPVTDATHYRCVPRATPAAAEH